jgi:HEPN domain-containing protein
MTGSFSHPIYTTSKDIIDWFAQAERDLAQAEESARSGRHEWACFAAQQAAEKAVKALHLYPKHEAWGHVVAQLLTELPDGLSVPPDLIEQARVLDNFSIPTRYPNGHPDGAPFEHYGRLQSDEALRHARAIVEFVRSQMA